MFRTPFAVLVPAQSRFRTMGELVAAARAAPGKLNYGSWASAASPMLPVR